MKPWERIPTEEILRICKATLEEYERLGMKDHPEYKKIEQQIKELTK